MNELKTLIDLCPGVRLPQYEPEIFSDTESGEYYLRELCEQYEWYYHGLSSPRIAYRYARYVMESTWPEAEHIIASNPGAAYLYASEVMKCRWPEAEALIATDREYRRWYNYKFGTNI